MKKLTVFAGCLVILILLSVIYYVKIQNKSELDEVTLVKSFNCSNAEVVSSEVYFWGRLDANYDNIDKLNALAQGFADKFGIIRDDASFACRTSGNDLVTAVELTGITADRQTVNLNIQSDMAHSADSDSYISLKVTEDFSCAGLEQTRKVADETFGKYGIEAKVNSCITGYFPGKLDYEGLNDISRRVFEGALAKKIEGINDRSLVSVSAYSPLIDSSVKAGGKKVNLNLAIRYNTYEDKTYIWLATPVILTEY